jgi:hypothetical protein
MIKLLIVLSIFLSGCEEKAEPFEKKESSQSSQHYEQGHIKTH